MSKHLSDFSFELEEWSSSTDRNLQFNLWISDRAVVYGIICGNGDLIKAECKTNNLQMKPEAFLTQILQNEILQVIPERCKSVNLFSIGSHWNLVPNLFIQGISVVSAAAMLFNTSVNASNVISYKSSILGSTFLAVFDPKFIGFITSIFPNYKIYHPIFRSLETHFNIHLQLKHRMTASVDLMDNYFVYTITKNNKLIFVNFYPMNAPEDVIYHIFRVNQSLQIVAKEIFIYVSGASAMKRNVQNLIKTYFINYTNITGLLPRNSWLEKIGYRYDDFCFLFLRNNFDSELRES